MERGLKNQKAAELLKTFGKNEITIKKQFFVVSLFLSQFPTFINGILALAALFSFFIGDILDGGLILFILVLNGIFGFIQEYKAEKSLEKLQAFVTPLSRVLRDGKEVQIPTSEIVPQDLVILSEGDRIPADGGIVYSSHMEIDESLLTGESIPVIKKQNDEIFGGTLVVKGKGHLLVKKTGLNSRFGQIAQTLSSIETDKTPLQKNLTVLGKILSFIALGISMSLVTIGLMQGKPLLPIILVAVSIAIAAIPEGLPAVITIALAIGTSRMAKKKAIIRKMPAVETLGSVQVVISDKTGTLTQNAMRVKKHWVKEKDFLPDILRASILGNTASLIRKEDGGEDWDVIGDKTDGALLLFAQAHIKNLESFKKEGRIIDEYVFDPETKTITTVFEKNKKRFVFVRGAPEEIIEKSTLKDDEKEKIKSQYESYAKEGLRVIAFGSKIESHDNKKREHLESNLEFLGFIGIYDPPRIEAKNTLKKAKQAGINIVMVTGDNELTALTIAKEIELIEKDEDIITGEELEQIADEELKKVLPKTRIFARAEPQHKLRLVRLFKEMGYVVGVTGDGINDTLALKRADVGIAMGEKGTDVAREASDIVLLDDNFATLVSAIEEGRTIYSNIAKAVTYLLSGNLAEISLVFFAAIFGLPSPLLPTQILWINLVTDGLPALALASDTKDTGLLKKKPRDPKQPILTSARILFVVLVGFGLSLSLLYLFHFLLGKGNETLARTITFNLLIIFHLLLAFIVRGSSPFKAGRFLFATVFITILAQTLITTVPFLQTIFHLGF
ncbi:MAG: hypothetical protein A3G13_00165 [Candidatus Levybacteria bacterium RIFCSPLOWO2_12_FULL_37_7]|nr:MAG: hypothetical protein A3G13_00165 [Candidatus Levybacteria bacterium RIFCSPLOWO2_12_FULL_37_7]